MVDESHSRGEADLNPGEISQINSGSAESDSLFSVKKLRLCYISDPNSIHTRRWVGWFAKRGHKVCLLADVPLKVPWPEIPVIDLSKFFWAPIMRFPVWAVWLRGYIQNWQPDILHAHRVNSAGWLGAASGFHPFVVTPWGSDVFIGPQRSWVARLLARYTLQHADCITTISKAISDRVVQLGARSKQLRMIYHGVDASIFHPVATSSAISNELRQSLSLPDHARLVFSPRAVHPIYNLDIIVQAIPQVRERFPEVCFIFAEYNPDPVYKHTLDGLIADLGLGGAVRWLPPTANPGEMAERYRLSDMVLSVPSSDGGTPLTVIEAMACGKPVICSDLPAVREFIASGENGWLVPVRQSAPLAQAIIDILENPGQAIEFGRKAHQLVIEKADQNVELQRMEAVYYQLAGMAKG